MTCLFSREHYSPSLDAATATPAFVKQHSQKNILRQTIQNLIFVILVIAYRGQQFIIELKIWRGNAYNERGEQQLSDYLDYFHLKKGYMLSFNFNKKKTVGVKEVILGDKLLIEAVE